MDGLFAAQGLHVTIVPTPKIPPSTQDLINGQEAGKYDITAGDYVTYIEDQLGIADAGLTCASSPRPPTCSRTS